MTATAITPAHGLRTEPAFPGALVRGDRVLYLLHGQPVAEVVASATPLTSPPGYIAVRFVGRHVDVHYPARAHLQVARSEKSHR